MEITKSVTAGEKPQILFFIGGKWAPRFGEDWCSYQARTALTAPDTSCLFCQSVLARVCVILKDSVVELLHLCERSRCVIERVGAHIVVV